MDPGPETEVKRQKPRIMKQQIAKAAKLLEEKLSARAQRPSWRGCSIIIIARRV